MIRITYQKRNGDIIERDITGFTTHRVGEVTSMGWKIIDIKHKYKGKYYSLNKYDKIVQRQWNIEKKLIDLKRKIYTIFKEISNLIVIIFLFKYFKDVI